MYRPLLFTIAAFGVMTAPLSAQQFRQRARIMGGGNNVTGKCTVEVVVDGAAEVEIRGDNGMLRNLSGQPPQWRRFECTGVMPPNPADFRFRGVDGRGRVQLMRDPRQGGTAVVRIEDPEGGAEGYTFDLIWGGGGGYPVPGVPSGRVGVEPRGGGRWTTEQAIQGCREAVARQISDRYRTNDVSFRDVRIDDNPGRNDWVIGRVDVRRYGREDRYRFSCSVNFNNGVIRSAEVQPVEGYRDRSYEGGAFSSDRAMENCRRGVRDRLRNEGYGPVEFRSINVDDRPGRNDWIVGSVKADRYNRADYLNFSCSVDLRDGDLRSVDVSRR
jgi:hypothetical protein